MELPAEEIERIQRSVVEENKRQYSDELLWAMLTSRAEKYLANVSATCLMGTLVKKRNRDSPMWQRHWDQIVLENSNSKDVMQLVAWHLAQRGDQLITTWFAEFERQAFDIVYDHFYRPPHIELRDKIRLERMLSEKASK